MLTLVFSIVALVLVCVMSVDTIRMQRQMDRRYEEYRAERLRRHA